MKLILAGVGCGTPATMTQEVAAALSQADLVIGAPRLLKGLSGLSARLEPALSPEDILSRIEALSPESCCVVYSGDTGFYSGARTLLPLLEAQEIETRVLPGISSVLCFAAALGRPWQDWALCSAHGVSCDPVTAVMGGKPVCFLTGGSQGPDVLCRALQEAGLGALPVTVGERLSYPDQRILATTAEKAAQMKFNPLSVLLCEAAPRYPRRAAGFPDELFLREQVPMTKQLVRAGILALLGPEPEEICWDVGSGTGSVSVELSMQARRVYALERRSQAAAMTRKNREKFCCWNMTVLEGQAPECLAQLPPADKVFIGGSGGALGEIVAAAISKNPRVRIVVSAIALETLEQARTALSQAGCQVSVHQIAVSRSDRAAGLTMLRGENPIFLIAGQRP